MRQASNFREFAIVYGAFILTALSLGKLGALLLGPDLLAANWAVFAFLAAVMATGWGAAYLVKRSFFKNFP